MEPTLTVREQKRRESDNKILRATISLIGKKGYTASSIRDIAKEAGVTSGLITQRFESKENLVLQALYSTNRIWRELNTSVDMTAYKLLTRIIHDAKNMYEKDYEGFEFIYMMSISRDAPDTFQNLQRDIFYKRGIYEILKMAQSEGKLPDGELPILLNIFLCNALRLIRDYKSAGLKMPSDENFLSLIQYKDPIAEEHQKYRNKAFESVAKSYFNLIYFNINTGEYRIAKMIKEVEPYTKKYSNGQDFLNHTCEDMVDINYIEVVKKFIDLSTVIERLGDKTVITEDYEGIDKRTYRVSFISVLKEPDNEVVLFGMKTIKESI